MPLSYGLVPHLSKKLSKFPSERNHDNFSSSKFHQKWTLHYLQDIVEEQTPFFPLLELDLPRFVKLEIYVCLAKIVKNAKHLPISPPFIILSGSSHKNGTFFFSKLTPPQHCTSSEDLKKVRGWGGIDGVFFSLLLIFESFMSMVQNINWHFHLRIFHIVCVRLKIKDNIYSKELDRLLTSHITIIFIITTAYFFINHNAVHIVHHHRTVVNNTVNSILRGCLWFLTLSTLSTKLRIQTLSSGEGHEPPSK